MQIICNNLDENLIINDTVLHYVINPSGNLVVDVKKDSIYETVFVFTKSSDCHITVNLNENNAKCDVNALYFMKDFEKSLFNITVSHKVKNTNSSQNIKGVATNSSAFSFIGTIDVEKDAVKTDSNQLHLGLLLSDNAKISASPQLMIRADDVKCNHGSAVGELDKNQIFYLRSRGIDENDAKQILINAFFADILEKVKSDTIKSNFYRELNLEPEYI